MPAAFHQRRAGLTMFFMPVMWSVCRQRADVIVAAEAAGILRGK
jgi:hypothetical protein